MGLIHEALRNYSFYIKYQRYQVYTVSITTVFTYLVFSATVAIGVCLVRKLEQKKMIILLLILVNLSQLMYLGNAVNVLLSYTQVQSQVKEVKGIYIPSPA